MSNDAINEDPAAPSAARAHFEARLQFETDCSDVHAATSAGDPGFVLLDVRSPELYAQGHVPGAINIPHRTITEARMAEYGRNARFVVYCAGPQCNGAHKAAVRLARLGRPVKEMLGGIVGWKAEGLALHTKLEAAASEERAAEPRCGC